MELMYLTVDYDKRITTHHVGPLADYEIEAFKALGHDVIVIQGENLEIVQDIENMNPIPLQTAEEEVQMASALGFECVLDVRRGDRWCYFRKEGIQVWDSGVDKYGRRWCNSKYDEEAGIHSDHKYSKKLIWALEMKR
jgi:hypothetical protein